MVNNTLVTLRGWICACVLVWTGLSSVGACSCGIQCWSEPLSRAVFDILVMRSKIFNSFEHQKNLIENPKSISPVRKSVIIVIIIITAPSVLQN